MQSIMSFSGPQIWVSSGKWHAIFINTGYKMLFGTEPNQVILLIILATAVVLLFIEWIRLDLTAILNVLMWHNLMFPRVGFDPAQAQSWYSVRSDSL
jgi:hypothetical protein